MPYCVNCGVELETSCKSCPLCDTEVIIPKKLKKDIVEAPSYSPNFEIPKSTSKKYLAFVLSILMMLPNVVFLILDIFIWQGSVEKFIFAVSAVAWISLVFPLIWKKPQPIIMLALDMLSLLLCIYLFTDLTVKDTWFASLAMPIIISAWALAAMFIFWLRKPRTPSEKALAGIIAANLMCYVVEICTVVYCNSRLQLLISFAVTAASIPIMIFIIALRKSRRLSAWAKRKFFM